MRITMKTLSASPEGTLHPGRVYAVPRDVARERAMDLLDGGYAVRTDDDPATRTPAPATEDDGPQDKPLAKQSLAELQAYAAENDIDLGDAVKKADVLAAIKAAETGGS